MQTIDQMLKDNGFSSEEELHRAIDDGFRQVRQTIEAADEWRRKLEENSHRPGIRKEG